MKNLLSFIISVFTYANSFAQSNVNNLLSKLEGYIGKWKGEGWHYHNPEKTNYFIQTCKITPKLDGDVLLVEQLANLRDSPETIIFKKLAIWRLETGGRHIAVEQYRMPQTLTLKDWPMRMADL